MRYTYAKGAKSWTLVFALVAWYWDSMAYTLYCLLLLLLCESLSWAFWWKYSFSLWLCLVRRLVISIIPHPSARGTFCLSIRLRFSFYILQFCLCSFDYSKQICKQWYSIRVNIVFVWFWLLSSVSTILSIRSTRELLTQFFFHLLMLNSSILLIP